MSQFQAINAAQVLKQYGLRPNKALGQNFLVDEEHLARIVEAAGVREEDEVLEIGAGLGALTRRLAAAARRVVAVEIDAALLAPLAEIVRDHGNVEVLRGDILTLDLATLFTSSGYLVVANIPYYLTSNLLRHLLETSVRAARLALTVQKEVAERACAGPGDLSLLALSIQLYGAPRIAHRIPAGAFYPVPNVDSALLLVELYDHPELAADKLGPFFKVTKAAFAQKRKTLANSLASLPYWDKAAIENNLRAAGIDPRRRPQTLSLQEWGLLLENSPLP